jgi:hypothetical protein
MHDGLAGGLASVHSDICSCDARVPLIHEIPRSTNQVVTGATLCSTERKVVGHVPGTMSRWCLVTGYASRIMTASGFSDGVCLDATARSAAWILLMWDDRI